MTVGYFLNTRNCRLVAFELATAKHVIYSTFGTHLTRCTYLVCPLPLYTEFEYARGASARMHWTYMNRGFNRSVIRKWKDNGLQGEAEKLLGYRLTLLLSSCDETAKASDALYMVITIKNAGWAAPINPREVT